jgi:hypothetical protein
VYGVPFGPFTHTGSTVEETIVAFLLRERSGRAVTAEWLAGRLCLPLSACETALERLASRGAVRRHEVDRVRRYRLVDAAVRSGSSAPRWLRLGPVALGLLCTVPVWLMAAAPGQSLLDRTTWTTLAALALVACLDRALSA